MTVRLPSRERVRDNGGSEMRKLLVLAGVLALAVSSSSHAKTPFVETGGEDWDAYLNEIGAPTVGGLVDTVWFGGDGVGNVVRGSNWNWETDDGSTPLFFPDGDPVGNQYLDGWTLSDQSSRRGPAVLGTGHWKPDGTYDFSLDGLSYAHAAGAHPNDGVNDGPDPLGQSQRSVWIGTNMYLNPRDCGWGQTAGYGDGWAQGIRKTYNGLPAGQTLSIEFNHRYAVESGFDSCFVEYSFDNVFWEQIGSTENPFGIYNGGTKSAPLPAIGGQAETVTILSPGQNPGGTIHLRFRLVSDGLLSDESEGGEYFYGWQIDDVTVKSNGVPQDFADFESDMGGWSPDVFEGFDFQTTLSNTLSAGRIEALSNINCPYTVPCPEACSLEGNVLLFADRDDCDLNDEFMDSFAISPEIEIGGPANPDIDNVAGRLAAFDIYWHGGPDGSFQTGRMLCVVFNPFNQSNCPYTPPAGDPGAGNTYNWSRKNDPACSAVFTSSPTCIEQSLNDVSDFVPASADKVLLYAGAYSYCRSDANCDPNDEGSPFFDHIRFGVYDPAGASVANGTNQRYSDSFPLAAYGSVLGADPNTVRMDGAQSHTQVIGLENPLRWVRADSAAAAIGRPNTEVFLRFRVTPGPCQTFGNAFWSAFPQNQWHAAQMDTARQQGNGSPSQSGEFMTCFHPDSPHDGTSWGGDMTVVETCDDIIGDNILVSGAKVEYFFEARDATSGAVVGTSPAGRNFSPIGITDNYQPFWRVARTLPELNGGAQCDPNNAGHRANNVLVVHETESNVSRTRLMATLDAFEIDYDFYQSNGTNFGSAYNGIGRREDRAAQPPRPPVNGATQAQVEPYDCIWYATDALNSDVILTDTQTFSFFGGQPGRDQQQLEFWLSGCTSGNNRFLLIDGYGWASNTETTTNGPTFLNARGVDAVADDYEATHNDRRRCARIKRVAGGVSGISDFDGEVFGTGCPDDISGDILAAVVDGEVVANYWQGSSTPECGDDQDLGAANAVIIRETSGSGGCARSASISGSFVRMHDLDCTDNCLFQSWELGSDMAQMLSELFAWAGKPIGNPIGISEPAAVPQVATALIDARPNPANPSAKIAFTLADQGQVTLRIFDVSGRLVRTLVDEVLEASNETFERTWDGMDDAGRHVGSGVFFYQLDAPGYSSAKKLVILK